MLKSHVKFHSVSGKRQLLIVEDELVNRMLLSGMLETEYEVTTAESGEQALELLGALHTTMSMVLLDLNLPGISGLEVLRRMKSDDHLKDIPVIVMTADRDAEVESLHLGAIDFIPKPYPRPETVSARIQRAIELTEDRQIIQFTERDSLTGLYNKEYFYRYAEQFDQYHEAMSMDAIVVDINHFHMINERYGKAAGDHVLRSIGEHLREKVQDEGGIVCRRESDTFLVYCPHREDYPALLDNASVSLTGDENSTENRVRLRMGVYADCDKTVDIERRFDRAKTAADSAKGNLSHPIGIYDMALHEAELYTEQLLEDFPEALRQRQFRVYYQPKFNIRTKTPVLSSAEALIRWKHPTLGMISPAKFIPLFEENGLIQQLDLYVWREAAAQVRDWKDRFHVSVPVSVNVSRVDLYEPDLIDTFRGIMTEFGLTAREYLLEITESAYTEDSDQIIETVGQLRELGFQIEMDDFGTGYSSLGMISTMPIDALKLDMIFVRKAFTEHRDVRLLELIIYIADYLHVPVIAEGVETLDQVNILKSLGCDIAQGYYFSKPVAPEDFERFVKDKRAFDIALVEESRALRGRVKGQNTSADISAAGEAGSSAPSAVSASSALDASISPTATAASPSASSVQMQTRAVIPAAEKPASGKAADNTTGNVSYGYIAQALAGDYYSIYYVDTKSETFVEYSSNSTYQKLEIEKSGSNFFEEAARNIRRVVYSDDREKALSIWNKKNLLRALRDDSTFTTSYRFIIEDKPVYMSMKVMQTGGAEDSHIIIAISNIDAQMRREKEFAEAKEASLRDTLTGVKNRRAFEAAEQKLDDAIAQKAMSEFSVIVCDLNGLKTVNDTLGYEAGDQMLQDACRAICTIFRHSPVYRIGGDEFAVTLRGKDYENRAALMEELARQNAQHLRDGGAVIAAGLSDFFPGQDTSMRDVFLRADTAMVENKSELKKAGTAPQ